MHFGGSSTAIKSKNFSAKIAAKKIQKFNDVYYMHFVTLRLLSTGLSGMKTTF